MFYAKDLTTSELLAFTLRESKDSELFNRLESLRSLDSVTEGELRNQGIPPASARRLLAIIELARRYGAEPVRADAVNCPADVARILGSEMRFLDHEEFRALYLNAKHRVLAIQTISVGSLTSTIVHPRELFKPAILRSAAAVVACHNHPSGDVEPSSVDLALTRRLRDAGEVLGIQLLDHIILGESGRYTSLKERGVL